MDAPFGVWLPQVTIVRCHTLQGGQPALEALRRRHCVVLQLDAAEAQEAQRILDFLSGAVTALDGAVECIDARTFLFCPSGVALSRC